MTRRADVTLLTMVLMFVALGGARADDIQVIAVTLKDGVVAPQHIDVGAGKPFKLAIENIGSSAAEFESQRLYKEKMLAPGAKLLVAFNGLSAGTYQFFDEFHMNLDSANGTITAK